MIPFSDSDVLYGCLATQHGLGAAGFARLVAACGTAEGVYGAGEVTWREAHPRISDAMVASLRQGPDTEAFGRLAARCAERGVALATPAGPGAALFPEVLKALAAPPPVLYIRGVWTPRDARAVALVGTRAPSTYGREAARVLARDLAEAGCTVVSGLALGVDAAAHAGALEAAGGRTLAVVGCGLDIDYPAENRAVRALIEERGAVISEHPPGTVAHAAFFPRRNRLISALARATVVVEAGAASGALHTAEFAREQGRAVFAVPGPIFSAGSAGTHALLRAGARLAGAAGDVLAVIDGPQAASDSSPSSSASPARGGRAPEGLGAPMRRVKPVRAPRAQPGAPAPKARAKSAAPAPLPGTAAARAVATLEPALAGVLALWDAGDHGEDTGAEAAWALDTLAARAVARGLFAAPASPALLEALLGLELRGLVRRAPGGVYRRA